MLSRHLGAQVTIERYGQFIGFLKLFMRFLGLVILLFSYHEMKSVVPTVKKLNQVYNR